MNWLHELRERRVPQFVLSYVVGGFGLIQFLEFLEGRMNLSPHLVNLFGLALLLLLPSIVVLAWSLGRPGDDTLGRKQKFVIPANTLAAAVLLFVVFQGKELGAVTHTIEVEDENGQVTERAIPKNAFRKRLLVYYPESSLAESDTWIRESVALLISGDISQDIFLDVAMPMNMATAMRDAGHVDGHGLPRALMRKIAVDGHYSHYMTGSIEREEETWVLTTILNASETGRLMAEREYRGRDLFKLVDQASLQMRGDLGIPSSHLESAPDLPVSELTSSDLEAIQSHAAGLAAVTHHNDWKGAAPHLEAAVARDPGYALAQYLLFGVYQTNGESEKSKAAMAMAMENLYRVTERGRFLIKSQYYFNVEQDMDKAMAVLEMWSDLYPSDIEALQMQALFHFIRQDLRAAAQAYETILEIDPTQYHVLEEMARLYRQLGEYDRAEASLQRYIALFPSRADGYDDLYEFYNEIGRLEDARQALDQALLLEPGDQSLRMQSIDLEMKQGRYVEVEAAITNELSQAKGDRALARVHTRRLSLGQNQGRADMVADALDSFYVHLAAVQNPLQLDIIYSMTLPALSMSGRPDETIARLDAVAARVPDPFGDLTGIGRAWALTDLGRTAEAKVQLQKATEVVNTYQFETFRAWLSMIAGMIARIEGDTETAVAQFRQAIEQAPQYDPNMYVQLAGALRESDDLKEARRVIEDGLKVYPAHPAGNLELARIELASGAKDAAAERLEVALSAWQKASVEYLPAVEARELARRLGESP